MSYDIFYDKQFIKAEKDNKTVFFPMFYGGSSNCYEVGRNGRSGRRERSWHNSTYALKGKRFGTLEEILASVEAERERVIQSNKESNEHYIAEGKSDWCDTYSDLRWGYFTATSIGGGGCTATFGAYKGLYLTGCKKALTVEELRKFNVHVHIYSYIYSDEKKAEFKKAGKIPVNCYPETSAELIEKIELFEEYLKDLPYVSLYVDIDADENTMKRIRKEKFPKVKKEKINISSLPEFYVIKDTLRNNYVIKFTRKGYRYSLYGSDLCKRFEKKKEAERYAKNACNKYREDGRFIVETIVNKKVGVAV